MPFATDTYLSGQHVRLVPLRTEHQDDLVEGVHDGALWKPWYTALPGPEGLAAEIERRHEVQGALRDTCVCSILASEWPSMRAHLDFQLTRART